METLISSSLYTFMAAVIGVLLIMGLIAIVQYIVGRDKTYFFWALYLLSNTFFFFAEANRVFELHLIPIQKSNNDALPWTIPTQYLVQAAYILFINSFLEIRKFQPSIYKFTKLILGFNILGFLFGLVAVLTYEKWFLCVKADAFLIITNLLLLVLIIKILQAHVPQKRLILIGSLGVLFTATISVLLEVFEIIPTMFIFIPIVCFGVGTIFELMLFSMALSNRNRLTQLEILRLQEQYTTKLELDLAERVAFIQQQNKELEEQRIINLTT